MTTSNERADELIGIQAPAALRAAIVQWAERQPDALSLSEAVCQLVELGLARVAESEQQQSAKRSRADAMASRQLDRLADESASPQEQANRKRHLLGGPEEFHAVRLDRLDGPDKRS